MSSSDVDAGEISLPITGWQSKTNIAAEIDTTDIFISTYSCVKKDTAQNRRKRVHDMLRRKHYAIVGDGQ